jgi:hypothetical protein
MEWSPSSEADSQSGGQEIPSLLCNPNIHYRVLVAILSQMHPLHTFPSYFP